MEDKERKRKNINPTVIGMAESDHMQKHGEAASQIIQAYKGVRYDSAGNPEIFKGRNLKDISNYKLNPEYIDQNIKQQSGFSAELIKESRDNKNAILAGDKTRTRTTDGLGSINNPQYDHMRVDANGIPIDGSGSQMKFMGKNKQGGYTVVDKVAKDRAWDRYDGVIDIPKEQYENALAYADNKAAQYRKNAKRLRELGRKDKATEQERLAEQYEKAKGRFRKSDITTEEALEARLNPEKFVNKEVLSDSHYAGEEAAKSALLLSGSISIAQNLYAVIAEDKPLDEAIIEVAKTTVLSGGVAYGVGYSGTALKATMHSSRNEMVRRLGNTSAPAMIATATVEVGLSVKRYASGDINEEELLQELGEKGTGMVAASYATAVGSIVGGAVGSAIPIVGTAVGSVVGGFIGSMIGYNSSSILYRGALETLENERISYERRKIIERLAEDAIKEQERYRAMISMYAEERKFQFRDSCEEILSEIEESIATNNINRFIVGMNQFGTLFGVKMNFDSFEEIDQFMLDDDVVFIL